MSINKRKILCRVVEEGLWENLSPEEIRLYLLLIIITDKRRGEGKLSLREINHCLGHKFTLKQVEKRMYNLQRFNLIKVTCCEQWSIQFQLLSPLR